MIEIDFQGIYESLIDTLPENWKRIVVQYICWEGSSEVKYFVKGNDSKFTDCFELGIPDVTLFSVLMRITELIETENNECRVLTISIDSDASFHAEADYSDNIDEDVNYMDKWRAEYLK